jgi:hypothetical protein
MHFDQREQQVSTQLNAGHDIHNNTNTINTNKRIYNFRSPWFLGIMALVGIIVTMGGIKAVPLIWNNVSTPRNLTSTPSKVSKMTSSRTPQQRATPSPVSLSQYPFSNDLVFFDPLSQNTPGEGLLEIIAGASIQVLYSKIANSTSITQVGLSPHATTHVVTAISLMKLLSAISRVKAASGSSSAATDSRITAF